MTSDEHDAPGSYRVSDDSSSSSEVELMVHSRSRRANAGNRMSKLIAVEEADDFGRSIYEALEDVPDDADFGDSDADEELDDVSLKSSSGDESSSKDGENGGQGELEGEKELQKEERRHKRSTKRKARDNLLKRPGLVKRARLRDNPDGGPATVGSASIFGKSESKQQPRRKKSERVSWLASEDPAADSSRRLSNRASTLKSRVETHERIVSKERARLSTVATMRAAEERREAAKPKPLTQEERLAEAAQTERLNAKSLNRWEEAEKKRVAERRAKLEAQRRRELKGEFIRFWSGSCWERRGPKNTEERQSLSNRTIIMNGNAFNQAHIDVGTQISTRISEPNMANENAVDLTPTSIGTPAALPDQLQTAQLNMPRQLHMSQTSNHTDGGQSQVRLAKLPESNPADLQQTQQSQDAVLQSAGFLDGIQYWAKQPEHLQRLETAGSSAATPKPISASLTTGVRADNPATTEASSNIAAANDTSNSQYQDGMVDVASSKPSAEQAEPDAIVPLELPIPTPELQDHATPSGEASPHRDKPQHQTSNGSPQNLPTEQRPAPETNSKAQPNLSNERILRNLIILHNIERLQNTHQNNKLSARERDRDRDIIRWKLLDWPSTSTGAATAGALGMKSMYLVFTYSIPLASYIYLSENVLLELPYAIEFAPIC